MAIWGAITENWGAKLFALAAAAGLWIFFAGEAETSTSIPVTVQYRNAPEQMEISSEPPERLFLQLRGPASRLSFTSLSQTTLSLDLAAHSGEGEQTFTVDERKLGLPAGVQLLRAVPSQVRVRLERRLTKEVPVVIRYAGPPPSGFRMTDVQVEPATVRVVGPESRVRKVIQVETDTVDLEPMPGPTEIMVTAALSDPQVRFESALPDILVRVTLERLP